MAADVPDEIGGCQRVFGAPTLTVPHQPLAPCCDIPPVRVITARERERQRIVCAPHGLLGLGVGIRIGRVRGDIGK